MIVWIEIDFVTPTTVTEPEVDGKRLIQMMKDTYNRHIFCERQKFVCDFEGNLLLVTVKEMEVFDTKTLESNGTELKEVAIIGMLTKNTSLRILKPKSSMVRLVNLPSEASTTTDIFNTQVTFEKLGIGGLDKQLNNIFRRAFASRIYPAGVFPTVRCQARKGYHFVWSSRYR